MSDNPTPPDVSQARKVKVTFGGSHRKNARCITALKPFLASTLIMPAALNSKRIEATVFDTAEMRAVLASINGSVKRVQPAWLNEYRTP